MTTPSPLPSAEAESNYLKNAAWIQRSSLAEKSEAFQDLFASFLTIKHYRVLLFGVQLHIRKHVTDDFISEVMIIDFNRIILCLSNYSEDDRRGVTEAYDAMKLALKELYYADGKRKYLPDAVIDCRDYLRTAYGQLEHLDEHTKSLPPPVVQ